MTSDEKYVYTCEHPFRGITENTTKCLFCPFCETSTSCDVNMYLHKYRVYFWCTVCDMKCIVGDVYKMHDVPDYPSLAFEMSDIFKCKLLFIATLTNSFLSSYCGNMDTDATVKFFNSAVEYAREHKVNIDSLVYNKEFNERNAFIRDYKLQRQTLFSNPLQITVNSYDVDKLSIAYPPDMTFHRTSNVLELKILEGKRKEMFIFSANETPWHKK